MELSRVNDLRPRRSRSYLSILFGPTENQFLGGHSSTLHFMASKLSSFIEVRIIWPYSIDQDGFRSVQVVGSQLFY